MNKDKRRKQHILINAALAVISLATILSLIFKDYANINVFGYIVVTGAIIAAGIMFYLIMSSSLEKRRGQKLRRMKTIRRNLYNL